MILKLLKRNIVLLLLSLTLATNAQNIDSLFVNMPNIINPLQNKNIRKLMLTDFKLHKTEGMLNLLRTKSMVIQYDSLNNYIAIKNTPSSSFEMKKFRLNDGSEIIGMIRSFGDSLNSSNITFYNMDWSASQLRFEIPVASNWLNKNLLSNANIDVLWAEKQFLISFIALKFTGSGLSVEAKNNSLMYLTDETKKTLRPFVSDKNITYEYAENKWEKLNAENF
ncbi:MAG: DUF3256 family protein [Paludibacter sp.]|nr:DUF3256 family protein [Paludibacter sp.]